MAVVITPGAGDLGRGCRDPAYGGSFAERSQKIVDKPELTNTLCGREATTTIGNRYF